jgi:hypothetical protein
MFSFLGLWVPEHYIEGSPGITRGVEHAPFRKRLGWHEGCQSLLTRPGTLMEFWAAIHAAGPPAFGPPSPHTPPPEERPNLDNEVALRQVAQCWSEVIKFLSYTKGHFTHESRAVTF